MTSTTQHGPVSQALQQLTVQCLWVMISRALRAIGGDEAVPKGPLWSAAVESLVRELSPALVGDRERVRNYANRTPSSTVPNLFMLATEQVSVEGIPAAEIFLVDYTTRLLEALMRDEDALVSLLRWFESDVASKRLRIRETAGRVHKQLTAAFVPARASMMSE